MAAKSNRVIAALKTGAKVAATVIFLLVGFAFVGIAGAINYHASAGQGEFWAYAAIGTTALTSALIEAALLLFTRRNYVAGVLALVLAVPFFSQNWFTASGNVASADKQTEDARTAHDRTVTSLTDRRKDAVERRDEAKKAAAGETEGSALSKIERIKADHPSSWNHSNGCDTAQIHLPITKQVCGEIAALKAKAEAAKVYVKAVADIADIDAKSWNTGDVAAQSTSRGAGATIKVFAAQLGHDMTDEQGERFFEYQRGGGLELAAAIGPSVASLLAWLLFWSKEDKPAEAPKRRASAPISEPKPKMRARLASIVSRITAGRKEAEIIAFPAGSAREFYRRYLEPIDDPKARISAGAMQSRYAADCQSYGVAARSKTFSQELQALGVRHVKISGRPYYYGVKWRDVPLPAVAHQGPRMVVDNTRNTVSPAASAALI
jgi:hypothetical protein